MLEDPNLDEVELIYCGWAQETSTLLGQSFWFFNYTGLNILHLMHQHLSGLLNWSISTDYKASLYFQLASKILKVTLIIQHLDQIEERHQRQLLVPPHPDLWIHFVIIVVLAIYLLLTIPGAHTIDLGHLKGQQPNQTYVQPIWPHLPWISQGSSLTLLALSIQHRHSVTPLYHDFYGSRPKWVVTSQEASSHSRSVASWPAPVISPHLLFSRKQLQ